MTNPFAPGDRVRLIGWGGVVQIGKVVTGDECLTTVEFQDSEGYYTDDIENEDLTRMPQ